MYDMDASLSSQLGTNGNDRPCFAILCGMPALERLIVDGLQRVGFCHDPAANTLIVVDAPYGFALLALETMDQTQRHVIVTTNNTCPEYWEDVWNLQPTILLVSDCTHRELETALVRAAEGERYRITPPHSSRLTQTERAVLRLLARGLSNAQIGSMLILSEKRIGNTCTNIYQALHLHDRVAAALYYWGRQDLINTAPPPAVNEVLLAG